jgi:hypothetical protein
LRSMWGIYPWRRDDRNPKAESILPARDSRFFVLNIFI